MKINAITKQGLVGKELSLNISELIVLAGLATILADITINETTLKISGLSKEREKDVLNAILKAQAFLAKISDGVISLESAEKELFTLEEFLTPETMEDVIYNSSGGKYDGDIP